MRKQTEIPQIPSLRPDLEFHPGPMTVDGSPTCTVVDPLNGTYFKAHWPEMVIMQLLGTCRNLEELRQKLQQHTTLRLTAREVQAVCNDIHARNLSQQSTIGPVPELLRRNRTQARSWLEWLIANYIYLRVPLLNPDRFLSSTIAYVRILGSSAALMLYGMLLLCGLVLMLQRSGEYASTFLYFFNLRGALCYGLALAGVKLIHEFAHAYTAKSFGVRVPTMGLVFIVMWPIPFCEVTDAWKLQKRSQRLLISGAGILAEIAIAGIALLLWAFTRPGLLHSMGYLLSLVSLASTLLVNLNPAMRFDGYFILGDLWGVDNLRERAFAVTRWWLRKHLLGFNLPAPEEHLGGKRLVAMLIYSLYAWHYRLFLYLGIAVLVYYKFVKILGIFLFLIEISTFIVRPLLKEIQAIMRLRKQHGWNRRLGLTLTVLSGVLLWSALPLPGSLRAPAICVSRTTQVVYAPLPGIIAELNANRGHLVKPSETLAWVTSPGLNEQIRLAEIDYNILQREKAIIAASTEGKPLPEQKEEEISRMEAKLRGLYLSRRQSRIMARISGRVIEWDQELAIGQAVSRNAVLGKIADPEKVEVVAMVSEDNIDSLEVGQTVEFTPRGSVLAVTGKIKSIKTMRTSRLPFPALASGYGGDIAVTQDNDGNMIMVDSYYQVRVRLRTAQPLPAIGRTGYLKSHTIPRSRLARLARYIYRMLVRESEV